MSTVSSKSAPPDSTNQVELTAQMARNQVVPLPPLAEQHRIVAKVDELMALCDRLEAARAEREATRDRLAAASLARLNAPDPDPVTFRDHAAFALDNLTPLTVRRDQTKALRQTILNLAVRGKLVGQDPNDEPASEPLQRIELKRKKLYAAKLIPKPKKLPSLGDMPDVFPLPHGWAWSMLGQLCYRVADGPHFSPQYVPADKGVPLFSTRNVRVDGFDLSSVKYVSRDDHEKFYCAPGFLGHGLRENPMSKEVAGMVQSRRVKGAGSARTEGARRASGVGADGAAAGARALAPGQRWSASRKRDVVLRLLRGESLDTVSREVGVELYRLEAWQARALAGLELGLKAQAGEPLAAELDTAKRHIGELSIEIELLRERARAAERRLPLATRRSRR